MSGILTLVPKTAEEARAMVEAMTPADRAQVSPAWLARIRTPSVDYWTLGYTIVRTQDGVAIGQCGFKGPPLDGIVEIAYGVAPQYEGRGYATEAALALVTIAFESSSVQSVTAHTLEQNVASQRVLTKAGFRSLGQVIDPEDGPVLRWERNRAKG